MRPRRFRRFVLFAALALTPIRALAQGAGPETGGAAFLLIPVGARATALGQAAAADGGSSEAAFWNPAGLAWLPRSEFAIHHAQTFVSQNTALAAYLANDRLGSIGVSAYLVDYGPQDIVPLDGGGVTTGRISPKNIELLASYATDVAHTVAFGVNYKLIQFRQDCQGACGPAQTLVGTTQAFDAGAQAILAHGALRLGIAVRNVGFKLQIENRDQADPLPTRVQMGLAYRVYLGTAAQGDRLDARFLMDLQDAWGQYGNPDAHFGVELGYGDVVRLRTGYAFLHSEGSGPSVGIGVRYGRVGIDFARVFYASGTFDEPVYLSFRVGL